jgi:hypothetical protein
MIGSMNMVETLIHIRPKNAPLAKGQSYQLASKACGWYGRYGQISYHETGNLIKKVIGLTSTVQSSSPFRTWL